MRADAIAVAGIALVVVLVALVVLVLAAYAARDGFGDVPQEWKVFSEDSLDARYYENIEAATASEAAERFAAKWDRECGDGWSADVHKIGVIGPDREWVAIFPVTTKDGEKYTAAGGWFRKRTPVEHEEVF